MCVLHKLIFNLTRRRSI